MSKGYAKKHFYRMGQIDKDKPFFPLVRKMKKSGLPEWAVRAYFSGVQSTPDPWF